MKDTYTPGPWRVKYGDGTDGADGVAYIFGPGSWEEIAVIYGDRNREARARLIALAPEMLDALRAFCGDYESTPLQIPEIQAAYRHALAVIAKAEGVQP